MTDQAPERNDAPPAGPAASGTPAPDERPAAQTPVDELADTKAKADEYLSGWKRALADYANLQKAAERSREELSKFACAGLVGEMLPVLDGFRKAADHVPPAGADEASLRQWIEGVKLIEQQLETVLKKAGLTAIDGTGAAFDPSVHEAMMTRKEDGAGSGQVIEVLEAGYRLHDKVIRAAKVVVSE